MPTLLSPYRAALVPLPPGAKQIASCDQLLFHHDPINFSPLELLPEGSSRPADHRDHHILLVGSDAVWGSRVLSQRCLRRGCNRSCQQSAGCSTTPCSVSLAIANQPFGLMIDALDSLQPNKIYIATGYTLNHLPVLSSANSWPHGHSI